MLSSISLQVESILQIPLQSYEHDFTFIVNSKEFKTTSVYADLISPIIASKHLSDPTLDKYIINTNTPGDFNKVINLMNFQSQEFNEIDENFIIEVFEQLGTEKVNVQFTSDCDITKDNIFSHLRVHQKHPQFYAKELSKEIDYFSSHFYELKEELIENVKSGNYEPDDFVIESIINNNKLLLNSEGDLLDVVNELYCQDTNFSHLYEYVDFKNVESENIKQFIEVFDFNDLTSGTWQSIKWRISQEILGNGLINPQKHELREKFVGKFYNKPNEFDGIMNYLQAKSSIKDEVKITYSNIYACNYDVYLLFKYDDKNSHFQTNPNSGDSWICFEFTKHRVAPTNYIIRSYHENRSWHPRYWVLEGKESENGDWVTLDEQNDNADLNGGSFVHSFQVSNENNQTFKFLRLRLTGKTWVDNLGLLLNSIDFYGKLF